MNKTKLQQELQEKIKVGIKPSDLKKGKKNSPNKSNVVKTENIVKTNNQLLTPPPTPPLKPTKEGNSPSPISITNNIPTPPDSPLLQPTKPSKPSNNIKDLQEQVKCWSQTANNYLLNLSKTSAELFEAEKKIKKLESQGINKELEKALIEANEKIRKSEQSEQNNKELLEKVKELQTENKNLNKTIEELKNQTKNQEEIKEEPKEIKTFFCDICQLTKQGTYIRRMVDSPFELRTHGKTCYICSSCSPYVKEYNDTDFDKDNNPYKVY